MDSGQVTLTGIIDRESDRTHTMNIRVSQQLMLVSSIGGGMEGWGLGNRKGIVYWFKKIKSMT